MNIARLFRSITPKRRQDVQIPIVATLVLAIGLFANASSVQAASYSWTNTTASTYDDPGAYNPTGGPGGSADVANFTSLTGSVTVRLTNSFVETGSLQFGSPTTGGATATYTLDFGTNNFAGLNGAGGSASGFVFGQQGTSTIYIAVGTMYCTNGANPVNTRLTIARNNGAQAAVYLTNGNVVAGTLVIANNAGASGSKLVISGANSYWSNNNVVSIGNTASANFNSLVISNSGSMATLGVVQPGFQSPSHSNSVLVDTSARLVAINGVTIGAGAGSVGNRMTVQGGGGVDNGGKTIAIGSATSGTGNTLLIGASGTVSNVTTVNIFTGNSLSLSGGLLRVTVAVTNSAGTVSGSGTIAGDVVFTGTGTVTPSTGTLVGTLNITNNLTLASASTTVMNLDKGQAGSNDLLNVAGTMAQAGTLTVNNVGAALVGGDTFKLFTIGTKTGGFAVTNLPSLNSPLVWDGAQLGSAGIVSVVLPPAITGPDPQAVLTNTDVTISTVVTGVPVPVLQWQKGGVSLTNGPTGNGSTISGSTSSTLTISNAQVPDSGQYCLIASNISKSVTNCMTLEVTADTAAPLIGGPTDQNVISPNAATFTAVVAGIPTPTVQWQDNGVDIANATNTTLIIPGVTFALDGHQYSIIASNSAGIATNSAYLYVVVPPTIAVQPVSLVVTQTQGATFSVLSTNGVPAPTYQWYFNNVAIAGATSSNYTIASTAVSNAGTYKVTVANVVGSDTSSNATLTVNSIMSAGLTPANAATGVCYDTPLYMAFDRTPVSTGAGKIQIFNVTNSVTPVDTIDTFLGNIQSRTIGTETFNTFPIIITGSNVAIYPHLGVLSSNQTYYVTVDPGTFSETNGALFAGVTSTNVWVFTTKPTGPANPNNVIVAANGSADFCTVQGAVDSVPLNNGVNVLVNIRNGSYTEIVDTRTKSNITFRGQSRTGTIVKYTNNNNMNGSTHSRMSFKVFSNDIAIENLTLINTTPQGGSQAEALMVDNPSARFILNNAEVDSRQDTILANANTSQCYFYNSLVQGNFDYVWGGGNCYFDTCEFRTIPTANNYNLVATRTDTGTGTGPGGPGHWPGWGVDQFTSNGFSFVHCQLTRSSGTVSNITLAGANGTANGQAAFLYCSMDISNSNGYIAPTIASGVLSNELLWEFGNSNLDNTASASFGLVALTNGDDRLTCALDPTCWLNGWVPQLAPNVLSAPTNLTVNSGSPAAFTVSATGIPAPSYQWLKAGTNLVGQTSATLTIASTTYDDGGTYSVIVTNGSGSVTNSATLTVIPNALEAWQLAYFGCVSCPQAAANADPDGDGLSNAAEYAAGTDPTNSTSGLRIISTAAQGGDIVITWKTAGGRTNIVQATGGAGGNYTNDFTDISTPIVISGSGDQTTNYTESGGATNEPARYYRVRLSP
jgi:hypothetical protein